MRKYLILLAAALGSAACGDNEPGPEYSTPPVISEFSAPTEVVEGKIATVTARLTSTYGLYSAFINYYIDDRDPQTEYVSIGLRLYGADTFEAFYSADLPHLSAGTVVHYQLLVFNPFGAFGYSPIQTYTVGKAESSTQQID